MKKVLLVMLSVLMTITMLAGCAGSQSSTPSPSAPNVNTSTTQTPAATKKMAISMNAADEYCTALLAVMEAEAKALGYTITSTNAEGRADKQISDVENLVSKKPDVIVMRAVDPGASAPAAKAAMAAGIKLLIIDLPIFDADYNVHLTSDQGRVGELVGADIKKWLEADSTRVANMVYVDGSDIPPVQPRREKILEVEPKVNLLVRGTANWSAADAQTMVSAWITSQPDMNILGAMNDEMAIGAVQALNAAGKKLDLIYGCDGTQNGLLAVKNGEITATVITDPTTWGKKAVDLANRLVGGEAFELKASVDGTDAMVLVTKDNVDSYLKK